MQLTKYLAVVGTNWTHEIVQMVLNKSAEFAPMLACFENLSHEALQKLPSPRVLGTHLPLRFLPPKITERAKIVCVFRNPKDVAVSLHNYMCHINFLNYNATWNNYYKLFVNGDVPCGDWFDHVQDWERVITEHKTAQILTLKYEDMKQNLQETVSRIANFLCVDLGPKLTFEIANKCEFEAQYAERTTNVHEVIAKLTKDTPNFLYRKGEVGEWKNWFSVAQSEEFDKLYQERMKNSNLKLRYS
ncbi:hypothetical protein KUTeg_008791 [Tegillarca granosa]|uniref:Sulfotransferase domain-containing protein n=1 Tax=Tegillarca granosa TaxID=220873 RepID=A0ABQ9FD66_TEGGR|nr:hypothetical protein KUTeg_008791 [Tegillarca granosa]